MGRKFYSTSVYIMCCFWLVCTFFCVSECLFCSLPRRGYEYLHMLLFFKPLHFRLLHEEYAYSMVLVKLLCCSPRQTTLEISKFVSRTSCHVLWLLSVLSHGKNGNKSERLNSFRGIFSSNGFRVVFSINSSRLGRKQTKANNSSWKKHARMFAADCEFPIRIWIQSSSDRNRELLDFHFSLWPAAELPTAGRKHAQQFSTERVNNVSLD